LKNSRLAEDYIRRSVHRLAALETLFERESWADVVRESQEVVELSLKGLLRACLIEAPRVHDVSEVLLAQKNLLPPLIQDEVDALAEISKELRRDRELAFYGTEDLTPGDFYSRKDAEKAKAQAQRVVLLVQKSVGLQLK
jgi:HEPN domain-containing protein